MLRLKTATGVQHYADLLELCEEAAGPRAKPDTILGYLAGVVHRLLELHPVDDQTTVLRPLLDKIHVIPYETNAVTPE